MTTIPRFDCPSSSLGLRDLLRKTRRFVWICFVVGAGIHLGLTRIHGLEAEHKVVKPLTTQFVKRQPRLTKPLELKKRPQPRRRQIQRTMVAVKAKLEPGRSRARFQPTQALGGLTRPAVDIGRVPGLAGAGVEPRTFAKTIEGTKEARQKIDMSLELLDIKALDTGQHHAIVVQDPTDKRNIKGFFRLRYVYSKSMRLRHAGYWEDRTLRGLVAVIAAMNQHTDIRASFEGRIQFSDDELMKTPWVFGNIVGPFVFPYHEAVSVGRYLASGGFLMCDALVRLATVHSCFEQALATQGLHCSRHWTFDILRDDHPMYHCYFDFDGPPHGNWDLDYELAGDLEGIHLEGRLVQVTCQKAFIHLWNDPYNKHLRNERMIQFAVNSIIFALTQEGSITHRVMDAVR